MKITVSQKANFAAFIDRTVYFIVIVSVLFGVGVVFLEIFHYISDKVFEEKGIKIFGALALIL